MIVILARQHDRTAHALIERWRRHAAALLTPADLSVAGWLYDPRRPGKSRAVVSGQIIEVERIKGVLTRLPWVTAADLAHIRPCDRSYVAAEMMAFLLAWLSALDCTVVNRPTPTGLAGKNWRPEQWTHCASRLGVPVAIAKRGATRPGCIMRSEPPQTGVVVTVVGEACIGSLNDELAERARLIAKAAGASLLEVGFTGGAQDSCFTGAQVCPADVGDEVAEAILELLNGHDSRKLDL